MLLSWIVKTIPRSVRAFLALLVMLGSLALLFTALQDMFAPIGEVNKSMVFIKFVAGLAIGLPATGVFYWFQSLDDKKRHSASELATLNRAIEADKRERIYRESKVTPVFTSQGGTVNPSTPADKTKPTGAGPGII